MERAIDDSLSGDRIESDASTAEAWNESDASLTESLKGGGDSTAEGWKENDAAEGDYKAHSTSALDCTRPYSAAGH